MTKPHRPSTPRFHNDPSNAFLRELTAGAPVRVSRTDTHPFLTTVLREISAVLADPTLAHAMVEALGTALSERPSRPDRHARVRVLTEQGRIQVRWPDAAHDHEMTWLRRLPRLRGWFWSYPRSERLPWLTLEFEEEN